MFQVLDNALGNTEIKEFLRNDKKFDVVVVTISFLGEAGYYIARKFDASLAIYFSGQRSHPWVDHALGQPHNPSYLPNMFMLLGNEMTFTERLINFVLTLLHYAIRDYYLLGKSDELLDKHFPNDQRPSLLEIEKNATVAFGFTHPHILDGWRPTVPNYVDIGMMSCR